jgi:hypothetical protein
MKILFESITALANRAQTKQATVFANESLSPGGKAEEQVLIADTTGFHVYGDLHLTLELSAATEQDKANLFLEVLEDLARIISDFARANPNVLIFEVQGERIHLFLNRNQLNKGTIAELIEFSSYLTDAVYETIKPKVEDYWGGFCMAVDFGRAIVLSTGRDGDDSLISLGNPANRPAKRLARSPQVQSGHLALPIEIAEHSDEVRNVDGRYSVGDWIELNVTGRPRPIQKTANELILESVIANAKSADDLRRRERRMVAFAAKAAEVVPTDGATVTNPTFVEAFMIRVDLDGFTRRVETAFALNNQDAIKLLVLEFLQIMKIPDAFESYMGRPFIRLPWAGDCYNALLLPKDYEDYEAVRDYLPAVASLRWFDPDGKVSVTRDKSLAAVAAKNKWSIGVAGGEESKGRLLVANIETWHRRFLIAAGWGARRSLDAQNAKGLRPDESAIHDEDYAELEDCYREAYKEWQNGPTGYRKATAAALNQAEEEKLRHKVHVISRIPAVPIPSSRPFYDKRDSAGA